MGNPHPKLENLKHFTGKDDPRNGRKPKGVKHINTWIQELITDPAFEAKIQEGYKIVDYKGAPIKAIVKAQIIKAINGDTKAFDSLAKYGWTQKTETDLHVKELPRPLLEGIDELPSNDSNQEDSQA